MKKLTLVLTAACLACAGVLLVTRGGPEPAAQTSAEVLKESAPVPTSGVEALDAVAARTELVPSITPENLAPKSDVPGDPFQNMGPQPMTPKRRLEKFEAMLKPFLAATGTVDNAYDVVCASIMAIEMSQGQSISLDEDPVTFQEWRKRKGGGVISMDGRSCFVDEHLYPEFQAVKELMAINPRERMHAPDQVPGPITDLDARIRRLSSEALAYLKGAAK